MPHWTVSQLVPGVEKTSDYLVYLVQSSSRSRIKHRVDKAAWSGFGACSCEDFTLKHDKQARILAGATPNEEMECKHIKAVNRYMAIEATQAIIEARAVETPSGNESTGEAPPF